MRATFSFSTSLSFFFKSRLLQRTTYLIIPPVQKYAGAKENKARSLKSRYRGNQVWKFVGYVCIQLTFDRTRLVWYICRWCRRLPFQTQFSRKWSARRENFILLVLDLFFELYFLYIFIYFIYVCIHKSVYTCTENVHSKLCLNYYKKISCVWYRFLKINWAISFALATSCCNSKSILRDSEFSS